MEDSIFGAAGCLFAVLLLILVGFLLGAVIDSTVYERRAFVKTTACEATRGVVRRKLFSTDVVCIPSNARQDTTTINLQTR